MVNEADEDRFCYDALLLIMQVEMTGDAEPQFLLRIYCLCSSLFFFSLSLCV